MGHSIRRRKTRLCSYLFDSAAELEAWLTKHGFTDRRSDPDCCKHADGRWIVRTGRTLHMYGWLAIPARSP